LCSSTTRNFVNHNVVMEDIDSKVQYYSMLGQSGYYRVQFYW
jgi:hypothetical protein